MKTQFLICRQCGKKDVTVKGQHIGTSVNMKCPDCCSYLNIPGENNKYARLCRKCCPSWHRTKT